MGKYCSTAGSKLNKGQGILEVETCDLRLESEAKGGRVEVVAVVGYAASGSEGAVPVGGGEMVKPL